MTFCPGIERNTYTVVGHCARTRRLGVGIATHSLAVGGYALKVQSNVGAVASQAYADPRLIPIAMRLLRTGFSAPEVIQELATSDQYYDYRQVGVADRDGGVAVHTGAETTSWAGHVVGDGFVTMGNCLAGEHVVHAMANAFSTSEEEDLEERLLRAIEAGRDAGGQQHPMKERSAALVVYELETYALIDLRVDVHDDAVTELRRAYGVYKPYIPLYYQLRVKEPHRTPPQDEWLQGQQTRSRSPNSR